MRYWDMYENKLVRNFQSHQDMVCALEVHPYEDMIISGALDRVAMLWDLRKDKPVGKFAIFEDQKNAHLHVFPPAVCFDNLGMVFAISSGGTRIHLFDTRNFEKTEFAFFDFAAIAVSPIKFMKFSPCGKFILVTCYDGSIFTVDSFKGEIVAKYPASCEAEPVFGPDSNVVAYGAVDGLISFYNTLDGKRITQLKGHAGFPRVVKFNPIRAQLLSASVPVAIWNLPKTLI